MTIENTDIAFAMRKYNQLKTIATSTTRQGEHFLRYLDDAYYVITIGTEGPDAVTIYYITDYDAPDIIRDITRGGRCEPEIVDDSQWEYLHDCAASDETLRTNLKKWCNRVDGLRSAIKTFDFTGSVGAAPPIMGAMIELDIYNNDERLRRAAEMIRAGL